VINKEVIAHNPVLTKIIDWAIMAIVAIASFYAVASRTLSDVEEMKPLVRRHDKEIAVIGSQYSEIKDRLQTIETKIDRINR
jgi:peptidoglycan hydrolase CwlO-like protein